MLVLSRKAGQGLQLGPDIEITVVRVDGDQVRLGIRAPRNVTILRSELIAEIRDETKSAHGTADRKEERVQALKALSGKLGQPVQAKGPKGDGHAGVP
ncbi:MAG: carbon storage regulator CsrA [Planctomycetes bacterium]|nr:carbon storage regulator CsrA [Planctomycetota bacterium]